MEKVEIREIVKRENSRGKGGKKGLQIIHNACALGNRLVYII